MGSRGGRGRGRFGGGGFRFAKQEPFVLFPDIELPAFDKDKIEKNAELVRIKNTLQRSLRNLPYFMEETFAYEEEETVDIERYSDTKKRSRTEQISLENSGYMTLLPGYFPLELVKGATRRTVKKVKWNPKTGLKKLNRLEELEVKFENEDGKKRKEEEEEEEEVEEEDELEDYSDDDYQKNKDFDDDDEGNEDPEDNDDDFII